MESARDPDRDARAQLGRNELPPWWALDTPRYLPMPWLLRQLADWRRRGLCRTCGPFNVMECLCE